MLGKCFGIICSISIIFAILNSRVSAVTQSIVTGASKSVSLVISLVGMMALWNGFLNVLKDAGIIRKISRFLRPVLRFIFPKSFKENIATEEITACISANILGISNAATPTAIKAIEKMGKDRVVATDDMVTLCILGCCCFNLVPTTIIAIRSSMGASITYELIVPVWICSGICCIAGIILSRLFCRINGKN